MWPENWGFKDFVWSASCLTSSAANNTPFCKIYKGYLQERRQYWKDCNFT